MAALGLASARRVTCSPNSPIGFVDRSQETGEAGRFLDRPQTGEARSEQAHLAPGEKPHRHDLPGIHKSLQ